METITATYGSINQPDGVTPAGYVTRILRGGSTLREYSTPGQPSIDPGNIPNGPCTLTMARLDSLGNVIGSVVTREFEVTDGVMVEVPLSILVGGV